MEFADSIGILPSSLSDILKGRIKSLSKKTLLALELCRGINTHWLATGKGERYKEVIKIDSELIKDLFLLYDALDDNNQELFKLLCKAFALEQNKGN
ncbi:MAG: hypothetical protein ABUK01_15420 [Leptospirales bacterium]